MAAGCASGGFFLAEFQGPRRLPAEPADLEAGGKKPGAGESIVFGIEHAVKSKVVEAFLGLVTAAVPVSVEIGLAAGELSQELVKRGAVPAAVRLLGQNRVMSEDENRLPGGGRFLKLPGKPCELRITCPAVPGLCVGFARSAQFLEFRLGDGGPGVPGRVAVSAHLGGVEEQEAEPGLPNCIIGIGQAQLGRHPGPEVFGYLKVVVAEDMVESGFELGDNGLEIGKALEVPVDEISQVKGEGQVALVQLMNSFGKLPGAFAIEACPDLVGVDVLTVGHESEGEKRFLLGAGSALGGTYGGGGNSGAGAGKKAAACGHGGRIVVFCPGVDLIRPFRGENPVISARRGKTGGNSLIRGWDSGV